MRSLTEDRIALWRNAIRQFNIHKETEGVFHKAGYRHFEIEHELKNSKEETIKPDIVGWGERADSENNDFYFTLELTLNDKTKKEQLAKYSNAEPDVFRVFGIQSKKAPDVLLGVSQYVSNNEGYCQLIFGETLDVKFVDNIRDGELREALSCSIGMELKEIPEISFRILPESKGGEIRRGIVASILRAFGPENGDISAAEVMEEALDILFEHTGADERKNLTVRISNEIDVLVEKHLQEYIEKVSEGKYRLTEKGKAVHKTPNSRSAVESKLNEWMKQKQSALHSFSEFAPDS